MDIPILHKGKLRLRSGEEDELHKVTKPEGVEARLAFRSAADLKATFLPLSLAGSLRAHVEERHRT